jgi:hypothetical protein
VFDDEVLQQRLASHDQAVPGYRYEKKKIK